MMKKLASFIACLSVLACLSAQSLNDFRSVGSGNWDNTATWQYWDGTQWTTPAARPTSASNLITIRTGHTVTVTTNVTVDQTTVDAGGVLKVSSGTMTVNNGAATPDARVYGTLEITSTGAVSSTSTTLWIDGECYYNRNAGSIPMATWRTNSTLNLVGLINSAPGNRTQTFYNLIWNCGSQNAAINTGYTSLRTFNGLVKVVSTGTGSWVWASTGNSTKSFGAWEQTGGTVNMSSSTSGITAYVTGDFTMSGGTLTETGSSTANAWVFQSVGLHMFDKTGGTISQTISYSVGNDAELVIANNPLTGSGTFTLSFGGHLDIHDANGITSSSATGAVQVTGTRSYNTGAYYSYSGPAAQVTGDGLPADIAGLTIDNSSGVTLTNPVNVNGTLSILSGNIAGTYATDGFYSPDVYFLVIEESGMLIDGLDVSVSTPSLFPGRVNRAWELTGDYDDYKTVTFYWLSDDDLSLDWQLLDFAPSAYRGTEEFTGGYDVVSDPRWLTVYVGATLAKAEWTIGREENQTLPIELTSFTAVTTSGNNVLLRWITQSETNVSGYYVLRNTVDSAETALRISTLIPATNSADVSVYTFEDDEVYPGAYYYWLQNVDYSGAVVWFGPVTHTVANPPTETIPEIPVTTIIHSVFPNPFNPQTTILYSVAKPSPVTMRIFNIRGQLVTTYDAGFKGTGSYTITWDGRDDQGAVCPSGVYIVRITAGDATCQAKAVLRQ